jgi:hypothetical protein
MELGSMFPNKSKEDIEKAVMSTWSKEEAVFKLLGDNELGKTSLYCIQHQRHTITNNK